MSLVISNEVKLRHDGNRTILFSVNPSDYITEEAFAFLYPQQAIILSMFNGQREYHDIIELINHLFNLDNNDASQFLEKLLSFPVSKNRDIRSLLIDASIFIPKSPSVYDPKDFIVPAEAIDMSEVRCNIPCSLHILPTMRCITNCRYCYADSIGFHGMKEFGLPLFKRVLKEAKECGIETLNVSGGDFFCREDAFTLIESAFSEGMYLSIPTKYPLSKNQIELLSKMGLSTIQISIDAIQPEIIDMLVSKKSGYGIKILKTLDYLREYGIMVRTNTVLTPYNIHDAANLARYLAKMPHVFKSNFTCYARSLYRHHDSLFCSMEDVLKFETELNRIKDEFPNK